jgi:hypothetical protein
MLLFIVYNELQRQLIKPVLLLHRFLVLQITNLNLLFWSTTYNPEKKNTCIVII